MKKTMTRNIVIMAIVTVIMAVVLSLYIKNTGTVPAADNTASLADGTYTASEQGCLSEVAVTVTVTGGKVTNVAIDASGETPELGGAAAETLADELTKAGSTAGVDAVSGATLTSNAVFTAMDSCLAQAGTGSAGAEDLTDGTYTSSAKGCLSDVEVTVTVTGGKVTNVAIDASGETPELGGAAAETLADELTKAGSTAGVDAVSGATLTSNAVFTAMDSCLAQAGTGSAGAEDLTDGTYTSSAKGCLSDVEVTVTVSGGKVSEVAIDASGETPELGGAAAETLADALTKAGSTNGVDAVSGATLTSEAVFTAMNDCLSQAQ